MNNLVVLHLGAIGDFLLTLSVIQAVRDYLNADSVIVVASAPLGRVVAGRSAVDRWFEPEQVGLHSLFQDAGSLDDRLVDVLSDTRCVLNFTGDSSSPVHNRLVNHTSARVISVDPQPAEHTLTNLIHITLQWCDQIRAQGLDIGEPVITLICSRKEKGSGTFFLRKNRARPRANMVIHPGSGGMHKCWPLDRFIQLVDSLDSIEVSWIVGPAECETNKQLVETLTKRSAATNETLIINQSLDQVARVIANADLYLGNDSGITHLAAALGTPTIALFGPTVPDIWRPLGEHVRVVSSEHLDKPIENVVLEEVKEVLTKCLARVF